jgi:hypothetical protein
MYRPYGQGDGALPVVPAYGGPPMPYPPPNAAPVSGRVKHRNAFAVWLGLPLITLGIYSSVWYYKIHREMADVTRRPDAPVAGPLLVMLFLSWTVVAVIVSFFRTGNRIADAQRAAGLAPTCNPYIGLLLSFVFGLQTAYYQSELNKIADSRAVVGGPVGYPVA